MAHIKAIRTLKIIERMRDRCVRFCGSEHAECFAKSPRQLACIADMVVNRTGAISMLLGRRLNRPASHEDLIRDAFRDTNELTNYFQYLLIVKDMRELHDLVLDSDRNEKRSEVRYPIPCEHDNTLVVRSASLGSEDMEIINYSQSGVRLATPALIEPGIELECELRRRDGSADRIAFTAHVRNGSKTSSGLFAAGMRVTGAAGKKSFNFFSLVHSMFSGPEIF